MYMAKKQIFIAFVKVCNDIVTIVWVFLLFINDVHFRFNLRCETYYKVICRCNGYCLQ